MIVMAVMMMRVKEVVVSGGEWHEWLSLLGACCVVVVRGHAYASDRR